MRTNHILSTALLLLCGTGAMAQSGAAPAATQRALDPVQGAWRSATATERSAGAPTTAMADDVAAPQLDFEAFRLQRSDALARGKGSISAQDRAALQGMADAFKALAPESPEALLAEYHLQFPEQRAFDALERAAAKASGTDAMLAPLLTLAMVKNDDAALAERARDMKKRGGIAPGLYVYAEDMLLGVERDGVLLLNGEMDALPVWVLQHADGKRKDVLAVDRRLLAHQGYRSAIWRKAGATGDAPSDTGPAFAERLAAATARPLHLATSLDRAWIEALRQKLHPVGLVLRHERKAWNNIPTLEHNWERMKRSTAAGPLSRNYLLAGAVLLRHYRETGNEAAAAKVEHVLVRFAREIGATQDLHRTGVLLH